MLSMGNLARIAKVVALLLFLMPWVTISCAEQTLVSMSGVDLVTGNIKMSTPVPASSGQNGGDLYVIIGAVLILLSLVATFLLKGSKGALVAAIGAGAAAACLAFTVFVRIPNAARADSAMSGAGGAGGTGGMGGPTPEQIAQMIQVNVQIGFWLVLAALVAAVVLNVLAMRGAPPVAAATAAAPPADPPADPPPSV